jgi:transposase InsO family protein
LTGRYRFICEHHALYGVARLCRVLAVKRRQGYYEWLAAEPARQAREADDEHLAQLIRRIQAEHGGYEAPRIAAELRRRGLRINRKRVERVMRERGLTGITRRLRRSLTKQDTKAAPAPDLIRRDFTASAAGQRLVGDITYLPTAEGWLYQATTIDLFNREVVGHAIWRRTCAPNSSATPWNWLTGAAWSAQRDLPLRPRQYTSTTFRTTLTRLDMRPSMGRTGSCFDNAVAESFFASLKAEIGTRVFATRAQARRAVFAYLNYYNNQRLHSTVKHQTPREARVCYRPPIALAA